MVQNLRDIGCKAHMIDPETNRQFEVTALGGHFAGHMDGCALGIPEAPKTWHVCEFKTAKRKSFEQIKKKGVTKAEPKHYAQMQVYMHLTGMKRALYLVKNKDNEELYSERVEYNKTAAKALMDRAERIITSSAPPERISEREDWYECKWCDAKTICWGSPGSALCVLAINCRQCCHATPTMDGKARWVCERGKRGLSEADQVVACGEHLVLPGLISFAEPTNYGKDEKGNDFIEFTWRSKSKHFSDLNRWLHGQGQGMFSTKELMVLPGSKIANPIVKEVKEVFSAEATGYCSDDILSRYPESDARVVWKGPLKELQQTWYARYAEILDSLTPIAKCDAFEYKAIELEGGRVVIVWSDIKQLGSKEQCEIREGIQ